MNKSLISTNKNCKLDSYKIGEIEDLIFKTFLCAFVRFFTKIIGIRRRQVYFLNQYLI